MLTDMKFDKTVTHCPNCKQPIKDKAYTFQGVRICGVCSKIVQRSLEKAEQQISLVRSMYLEVLRVALLKGELQFPEGPVPKDIGKGELLDAMKQIASALGGKHGHPRIRAEEAGGPEGESQMHPLRNGPQDSEPVRDGNGLDAVPGRR